MSETFFLEAAGFSMRPFVKGGDRLIIKKVNAGDLRVGDIILYQNSTGQHICHRLINKKKSDNGIMLITRGDASLGTCEGIPGQNLEGLVASIIRDGKAINLRSKGELIRGWFIAKGFWAVRLIYLRSKIPAIAVLNFLQQSSFYRKCLKGIFYDQIVCRQVISEEDRKRFYNFSCLAFEGKVFVNPAVTPATDNLSPMRQFMALYGDRPVAVVSLEKRKDGAVSGWWLAGLNVRIRFRGAGIGEKLIGAVVRYVSEEGAPCLYLKVFNHNLKAVSFYRKLGFKELQDTAAQQMVMGLDLYIRGQNPRPLRARMENGRPVFRSRKPRASARPASSQK